MQETKRQKEFFEALGRLVWSFSGLDFLIRNNYWSLAGINPDRAKNEMKLELGRVIEDAIENVNNRFTTQLELQNKLISVLNECNIVKEKRNQIIHSSWWTDTQSEVKPYSALRLHKKFKNEFGGEWKDYTAHEINEITNEIKTVKMEFFKLIPEIIEIVKKEKIEGIKWLK